MNNTVKAMIDNLNISLATYEKNHKKAIEKLVADVCAIHKEGKGATDVKLSVTSTLRLYLGKPSEYLYDRCLAMQSGKISHHLFLAPPAIFKKLSRVHLVDQEKLVAGEGVPYVIPTSRAVALVNVNQHEIGATSVINQLLGSRRFRTVAEQNEYLNQTETIKEKQRQAGRDLLKAQMEAPAEKAEPEECTFDQIYIDKKKRRVDIPGKISLSTKQLLELVSILTD